MRQGEVEPHRVARVDASETLRDFLCRLPARGRPARQPQGEGDPVDVRVQRDRELPRQNPAPEPEIHAVIRAYDPPEKEIPALQGAPTPRIGQKEFQCPEPGASPVDRARVDVAQAPMKTDEGRAQVRLVPRPSSFEGPFQGSLLVQNPPNPFQEIGDVMRRRPSVTPSGERLEGSPGRGGADPAGGVRPQDAQDLFSLSEKRPHPAIGQEGRQKRRGFPVGCARIASRKLDGVARQTFSGGKAPGETGQNRFKGSAQAHPPHRTFQKETCRPRFDTFSQAPSSVLEKTC